MELCNQVAVLADNFAACTKILTALGDETRQHLILEMMQSGNCSGVRVCEITEKTNLSRPAVSHHLQILKAAMLAPTAMNQQKFCFELLPNGTVKATYGRGFYTKLDFGIVKYHFETVTGKKTV